MLPSEIPRFGPNLKAEPHVSLVDGVAIPACTSTRVKLD